MFTTEKEAAQKWCPLTRVILISPDGMPLSMPFNRTLQGDSQVISKAGPQQVTLNLPEAAQCAGSACMMWRWFDKETVPGRRGFCGLAMNPLTYQH